MQMDWVKDYFDDTYAKLFLEPVDPARTKSQVDFIVDTLGMAPPAEVADFGCGLGRHSIELAKRGYLTVGYDMNPGYVQRAANAAAGEGLISAFFFQQDMRMFDEIALFDIGLCLWVSFGYFDDETNSDMLWRMVRSLRPGGHFFMDLENREYILKNFIHEKWRMKDEFLVLERNRFDLLTSQLKCNRVLMKGQEKASKQRYIRLYTATELILLARCAGLDEIRFFGDWDGTPYNVNTPRMILCGRVPQ